MAETTNNKSSQVKAGSLLKYKKRIFKPNWRQSEVVLLNNATMITRSTNSRSGECSIQMTTQTTLIVFGRHLFDLPKKPLLPAGYGIEQLLAIGLICNLNESSSSERLSIVFHWFLTRNIQELFEWIIAINGIIPANKQIFTDEELTMSLIMSEAAFYNNLQIMQDSQTNNDTSGEGADVANSQHLQNHPIAGPEWTLSGADGVTDGYLGVEATGGHYTTNGTANGPFDMSGGGSGAMDCSDFDDCSAYASADAFAIF